MSKKKLARFKERQVGEGAAFPHPPIWQEPLAPCTPINVPTGFYTKAFPAENSIRGKPLFILHTLQITTFPAENTDKESLPLILPHIYLTFRVGPVNMGQEIIFQGANDAL